MLSFSVNSFAANFGWTLIFLPTTACEGSYDGWCALSSHVGMASAFNFCARKLAICALACGQGLQLVWLRVPIKSHCQIGPFFIPPYYDPFMTMHA